MGAMPVVVVEPGRQLSVAFLGVEVGAGVDPLPESGLDEPFGLAVGTRRIGTGEVVMQAELENGSPEGMGTITMAVIGEQAANGDAEAGVIGHSGVEESDRSRGGEGGQDLSEGNAGMVINGDVKVLPAAVMLAATTAIGTEGNVGEAAELLDIEVKQIAGGGMLITKDGDSRLEIAHTVQAQAAQNTADGRATQTGGLGNMEAGEALAPQLFDALCQRFPGTTGTAMGAGRTILETRWSLLAITAGPLGSGAGSNVERGGRCT